MRSMLASAALAAVVVLATPAARAADAAEPAAATTCSAYIEALPATIDMPGTYCLRRDLVSSYYAGAITVLASDVTVDCRNRRMSMATGQNPAGTNGVTVDMGLSGVKVQNCLLSGFDVGVWMPFNGARNAVRNNRIERFISAGIQAGGDAFEALNNRITDGGSAFNGTTGIQLTGDFTKGGSTGQMLTNNLVAGLYGVSVTGILATDSQGLRLVNNHVMGLRGNAGGPAAGMTFNNTPELQLINNAISAIDTAQRFIPMQSTTQPALCRGNTIHNSGQLSFYGCARSWDNVNVNTPIF